MKISRLIRKWNEVTCFVCYGHLPEQIESQIEPRFTLKYKKCRCCEKVFQKSILLWEKIKNDA